MKRKISLLVCLLFSALWRFEAVADPKLSPKTEAKIRAILDSPKLASAHVGISILDLGEVKNAADFPARAPIGKPFRTLFESDAQKKFMPASNMKLFTAAIALHLLGKEKTFPTRVYQHENQLVLRGGGDPSFGMNGIHDLVNQVVARGIKHFSELHSDGTAFTAETEGGKYPPGWTMDDARWYYGPEISALAIERNQLDIIITGGEKVGVPAKVALDSPIASQFFVNGNVTTGAPELRQKSEEDLIHFRWLENLPFVNGYKSRKPTLPVGGQVAPNQKIDLGIAFPNPPRIAASILWDVLLDKGLTPRFTFDPPSQNLQHANPKQVNPNLIAQHNSPPLEILLQRFLKKSDNLYAEMLLRDAAFYHDNEKNGTAPRAHELLKEWLIAQNIDTTSLRFEDGSGLSRYNLLTPRATSELLAAINRMPEGNAIWDALPIAGIDGTLKNRMGSTPGAGIVRAKTGTFSIASNLSGYVTTRDKKRLAVSLYVNFARDTETARWAQDAIFTILADGEIADENVK